MCLGYRLHSESIFYYLPSFLCVFNRGTGLVLTCRVDICTARDEVLNVQM